MGLKEPDFQQPATMHKNAVADFDFDEWAKLARDDPAEFERRRRAAIDALIASAPAQRRRLEGTQWRIDRERELAHTPLKACLRMSAMMWDSFLQMKSALDAITQSVADSDAPRLALVTEPLPHAEAPAPAHITARVLPFARPEPQDGEG